MTLDVRIRPARLDDVPGSDLHYICSTWITSAYPVHSWLPRGTYHRYMMLAVQRELGRCVVRVVCSASCEELVISWLCADPRRRVLHFSYTKPAYRRQGYASLLLGDLDSLVGGDIVISTLTPSAMTSKIYRRYEYRPGTYGRCYDSAIRSHQSNRRDLPRAADGRARASGAAPDGG